MIEFKNMPVGQENRNINRSQITSQTRRRRKDSALALLAWRTNNRFTAVSQEGLSLNLGPLSPVICIKHRKKQVAWAVYQDIKPRSSKTWRITTSEPWFPRNVDDCAALFWGPMLGIKTPWIPWVCWFRNRRIPLYSSLPEISQ